MFFSFHLSLISSENKLRHKAHWFIKAACCHCNSNCCYLSDPWNNYDSFQYRMLRLFAVLLNCRNVGAYIKMQNHNWTFFGCPVLPAVLHVLIKLLQLTYLFLGLRCRGIFSFMWIRVDFHAIFISLIHWINNTSPKAILPSVYS